VLEERASALQHVSRVEIRAELFADRWRILRSPASRWIGTTRSFMERRFGHDFSGVRVHAGARPAQSASAVHANAYTVGSHIAFGTDNTALRRLPGGGFCA